MEATLPTRETIRLDLAREILRSFGHLRFVARGGSMLPLVFPGDVLVVRRAEIGDMRCGQVVLSSREGRLCAHRVVQAIRGGGRLSLVTRGDALVEEDPPITEQEFLGEVAFALRGGKRIELAEKQGFLHRFFRWCVRHSDGLAISLLRWRSFLARRAKEPAARSDSAWPAGALLVGQVSRPVHVNCNHDANRAAQPKGYATAKLSNHPAAACAEYAPVECIR